MEFYGCLLRIYKYCYCNGVYVNPDLIKPTAHVVDLIPQFQWVPDGASSCFFLRYLKPDYVQLGQNQRWRFSLTELTDFLGFQKKGIKRSFSKMLIVVSTMWRPQNS